MKKQIMTALLGLALTAVMAGSVFAQAGRRVRVHVPFDFVVAGKQMPAGDYSVRRLSKDSENALLIQSEDGRSAATVFTNSSRHDAERAQLSFRQRGESYFLAEVSIPGTAGVRDVPRSKSEEKRVRELIEQAEADGGDSGKTVTVTGSLQ